MMAMLLAAQLAAQPPGDTQAGAPPNLGRPAPPIVQAEPTPNFYQEPARCADTTYKVVDRNGRPVRRKLADLPRGGVVLAVDRSIDGCRVIVVVSGNVWPQAPSWAPNIDRLRPSTKGH